MPDATSVKTQRSGSCHDTTGMEPPNTSPALYTVYILCRAYYVMKINLVLIDTAM